MNPYTCAVLIVMTFVFGGVYLIVHDHVVIGCLLCLCSAGVSVSTSKDSK